MAKMALKSLGMRFFFLLSLLKGCVFFNFSMPEKFDQ